MTVAVGPLTEAETDAALAHGLAAANHFRARGLISSAALFLNRHSCVLGALDLMEPQDA